LKTSTSSWKTKVRKTYSKSSLSVTQSPPNNWQRPNYRKVSFSLKTRLSMGDLCLKSKRAYCIRIYLVCTTSKAIYRKRAYTNSMQVRYHRNHPSKKQSNSTTWQWSNCGI